MNLWFPKRFIYTDTAITAAWIIFFVRETDISSCGADMLAKEFKNEKLQFQQMFSN